MRCGTSLEYTAADISSIDSYVVSTRAMIHDTLAELLHSTFRQSDEVHRAAAYTVLNGGHRWRPILLITVGKEYGTTDTSLLSIACVTEVVHAAAMILDDLPCMDNARLRHGQPACHLVFGEDVAILASHFLLLTCFRIINERYSAQITRELTNLVNDMIHGQAGDLKLKGRMARIAELRRIYRLKSGRLFGFSAKMGGVLAGAPAPEISNLEEFGQTLGVAYQVLDDIFDANGGPSDVGKEPGMDRDKSNFVALLGTRDSVRHAARYRELAVAELDLIPRDLARLKSLASQIVPLPKV